MTDRIVSFVFLLIAIAFLILTTYIGGLSLCIATVKHEWMVEHGMNKHSYVLAALAIVGEIVWLFILRRLVIFVYEAFILTFARTPHESV